jgi:hypothetical protein
LATPQLIFDKTKHFKTDSEGSPLWYNSVELLYKKERRITVHRQESKTKKKKEPSGKPQRKLGGRAEY